MTPRSLATVTLHGTGLDLGTSPAVTVGGVPAQVQGRARDRMTAKLGFQPEPGWQPVTVSTSAGSSTVVRGLGVLPLLDTDPPAVPGEPFELVLRGAQQDQVLVAVGLRRVQPLPLADWLHGLALDPSVMLMLPGAVITSPGGERRLPIPPSTWVSPVFLQALFVTNDPGYGPASFSNVVAL